MKSLRKKQNHVMREKGIIISGNCTRAAFSSWGDPWNGRDERGKGFMASAEGKCLPELGCWSLKKGGARSGQESKHSSECGGGKESAIRECKEQSFF